MSSRITSGLLLESFLRPSPPSTAVSHTRTRRLDDIMSPNIVRMYAESLTTMTCIFLPSRAVANCHYLPLITLPSTAATIALSKGLTT